MLHAVVSQGLSLYNLIDLRTENLDSCHVIEYFGYLGSLLIMSKASSLFRFCLHCLLHAIVVSTFDFAF